MTGLLQFVKGRLSNRQDSEHGQAIVRLAVICVVLAYMLLSPFHPGDAAYRQVMWIVVTGLVVGAGRSSPHQSRAPGFTLPFSRTPSWHRSSTPTRCRSTLSAT